MSGINLQIPINNLTAGTADESGLFPGILVRKKLPIVTEVTGGGEANITFTLRNGPGVLKEFAYCNTSVPDSWVIATESTPDFQVITDATANVSSVVDNELSTAARYAHGEAAYQCLLLVEQPDGTQFLVDPEIHNQA